jgi:hypothetical protein
VASAIAWAFALLSTLRILAYLPTLAAIHASGRADQHSVLTWITFLGANVAMAAWLSEQNGFRANRAVLVNLANALMCAAIVGLILWTRMAAT